MEKEQNELEKTHTLAHTQSEQSKIAKISFILFIAIFFYLSTKNAMKRQY